MIERVVSSHLDEIASLFAPGARLTLLVRHDLGPDRDADFVLTSDDLLPAIAALQRRLDRSAGSQAP